MRLAFRQHPRILLATAITVLLAATFIAYYPGLHGPYLFDDATNIASNTALRLDSFSPHALLRAAFSSRSGVLYRPLSMLSFAFNFRFFGEGLFSFKLTNLVIHLINAILILWLTRRLLANCKRRYRFDWQDNRINWMSVLIAGAWALHPLNLTAVLYIVQRMTSLAALFTLAGMLAYIYGRERTLAGKSGWPLVWLLTPCFGLIGVLCKEDAALLPLYLLMIEWLIFGFRSARGTLSRYTLAFYLFGLVIPGLIGIAYLVSHRFWTGYAYRDFTLPERGLTEFRVVFLYIKWTFFPDIRELALYHDDLAISTSLLHPVTTLLSLLALIALLALAIWQRRRRPLLSLGVLFFFAGQAMESTILPLEIAFEHRNYLPDYGLILAFFTLLQLPITWEAGSKTHVRVSLRWGIAVIILPVLFCVTLLRASEWDSYLDFSYYEALHHPKSQRAVYSLGQMYTVLAMAGNLKNPAKAFDTLERATSLNGSIMPDTAMMMMSAKLNMPVNPKWPERAEQNLRTQPLSVEAVDSLRSLVSCIPTYCGALAPTARTMIEVAFHSKNIGSVPQTAANLWVVYANYMTFTGAPLEAIIKAMQQSVNLQPETPRYQISLTKGLIMAGEFTPAADQIHQLSRLNRFGILDKDIEELNQNLSAGRAAADRWKHAKP